MSSLQLGRKKIIEMQDAERPGELFYMTFDLDQNPQEKLRVRVAKEGELLDRSDPAFTPDPQLVRYLKQMQEKARAHVLSRSAAVFDEETRKILKGIGYVEGR